MRIVATMLTDEAVATLRRLGEKKQSLAVRVMRRAMKPLMPREEISRDGRVVTVTMRSKNESMLYQATLRRVRELKKDISRRYGIPEDEFKLEVFFDG